jgi:hypothetical protein
MDLFEFIAQKFFVDIYFDCTEQVDDQELMEIFPKYQPWISEIRLSVHRK